MAVGRRLPWGSSTAVTPTSPDVLNDRLDPSKPLTIDEKRHHVKSDVADRCSMEGGAWGVANLSNRNMTTNKDGKHFGFPRNVEAAVFATAIAITCTVAKKQRFRTPLHGCCSDLGGCCVTCWCPCITWGQIAAFAWPDQLGDWWMGCCTYCCCSNLAQCMGMVSRQVVRDRMAIQGDMCQDCCIHCCAHTCALCQEARAVKARWQANGQQPLGGPQVPLQPVDSG